MSRNSQYSSELNAVQDAALATMTVCRDEIEELFATNSDGEDIVDATLKSLFAYQSARSQTVSYLISSNYVWDAEIVMRAFLEAHVKIWFICQASGDARVELVEEFWGDYAGMQARKRAVNAKLAEELAEREQKDSEATILGALSSAGIFDFHEGNRSSRKALNRKWSFSEIIAELENNSENSLPLFGVLGLKHIYGLQSHLIHADDSALDLMLDRRLRAPEELEALVCTHVCRIFSDQATLWCISTSALEHRYGLKLNNKWQEYWKRLHNLIDPFRRRFEESQAEFYGRTSHESPEG